MLWQLGGAGLFTESRYGGGMRCSGIDLAAEPKNTGIATLVTTTTGLRIEAVRVAVDDDDVIATITASDYTGVDVPVGWPQPFTEFLAAQAAQRLVAPESTGTAWRRTLALRATDRYVQQHVGLTPLSVSANLIAYPAFRWAGIEARLRQTDIEVARDGTGVIAEVYPAAALYRWGLNHTGYKGPRRGVVREQLVIGLSQVFPDLDFNGFEALMVANDNALDALIAALVSHEIQQGRCEPPPEELRDIVQTEGWIWVPHARR